MKVTIDAASKLIRNYSTEIMRMDSLESSNNMVCYSEGEEKLIPEYDMEKHQAELDRLNGNIQAIKHAINQFNCSYVLPNLGITIDVALVEMAVLSRRVAVMNRMRGVPKKSRSNTFRSETVEYREPNYSLELANQLYDKMSNRLTEIQSALNLANVTNEIEVDLK